LPFCRVVGTIWAAESGCVVIGSAPFAEPSEQLSMTRKPGSGYSLPLGLRRLPHHFGPLLVQTALFNCRFPQLICGLLSQNLLLPILATGIPQTAVKTFHADTNLPSYIAAHLGSLLTFFVVVCRLRRKPCSRPFASSYTGDRSATMIALGPVRVEPGGSKVVSSHRDPHEPMLAAVAEESP